MQITDILAQTGGLQSMARELGVSESQAQSGAEALLPAILGGFKKQTQAQPAGLDGLGGVLGQLGGGGLLDEVLAPQPTDVSRGNEVLGQTRLQGREPHGRAERGRAVGARSGILKKMLPMLAMLVAGYIAKRQVPVHGAVFARRAEVSVICSAACSGAGPRGAQCRALLSPGSRRCWTSTVTAMRWTTSCAWPARRCASPNFDR